MTMESLYEKGLKLRDGIAITYTLANEEAVWTAKFDGTTENDGAVFSYEPWVYALNCLQRSKRPLPFDLKKGLPGGELNTQEARELAQLFARQAFELAIEGPRGETWMWLAEFCWRGGFRILSGFSMFSAEPAGGAPGKELYLVQDETLSNPVWMWKEAGEILDDDRLSAFFGMGGMSVQGELVTGRHLLLISEWGKGDISDTREPLPSPEGPLPSPDYF